MAVTLRRAVVTAAAAAATAAAGEGSVSIAMVDPQTPAPVPLYDCFAEYDMWGTAWSPDWKAWCCANERRGCPSTTTTTATTSTRTSSTLTQTKTLTRTNTETTTTPKTTTKMRAPAATGCEVSCELKGVAAKCSERIAWSTQHETNHEKAPCEAAHVLVISQCPSCGNCTSQAAGCEHEDKDKDFLFKKKLQQKFAEPSSRVGQANTSSLAFVAGLASLAVVGSFAAAVAAARRGGRRQGSVRGAWLAMEDEAHDRTAASANE